MKIVLGVMLALLGTAATAQDLVVSGRVESITLIPFGAPSCPQLSGTHKGADGRETIVISNACGCEESKLKVEQVLQGSGVREGEVLTLRKPLGEWCKPALPLSHQPIRIQRDADGSHWKRLDSDAGQPLAVQHE